MNASSFSLEEMTFQVPHFVHSALNQKQHLRARSAATLKPFSLAA
jgi:hypothetical protein